MHWAYRENPSIVSCKACLDPYRLESKKILSIFRGACSRVEKASIDESFLDLSVMVHARLLALYPDLVLPPPYSDPTENLPLPPQDVELNWGGSHLLERGEEYDGIVDWDDVGMSIAAEIVNKVRGEVKEKLGYTCSAGVAQNKMLAKLGSGYKKPNQQVRYCSSFTVPIIRCTNNNCRLLSVTQLCKSSWAPSNSQRVSSGLYLIMLCTNRLLESPESRR